MRFLWSIWLILLTLTACGGGVAADQPPDIRYGEDPCDECHMLIQDKRFAAAYITEDAQSYRFDDIGDMLLHMQKHSPQIASAWVHDYDTEEWLRAEEAFYVHASSLHTPMGYGLAAFATRERAEAFANEHEGMVMTFDALRAKDADTLRNASAPDGASEHNH